MSQDFKTELLALLDKHNQIGNYSRYKMIREKYKKMRDEGISGKAAREKLAEEFFVSEKTIETALYKKKEPQINIFGDRSNKVIVIIE